jgi:hypothetical protein
MRSLRPEGHQEPNLSRDGVRVAYFIPHGESYGPGFGDIRNEVWVKSLVDGTEVPVPPDDYSSWFPLWSPDGTELIYGRRNLRTNEYQLMLWASQTHDQEQLAPPNVRMFVWDRSRDGKWLLGEHEGDIWLIPFPLEPRAETAAQKVVSSGVQAQPRLSGRRWIVFEAVNSLNPSALVDCVA